MPSSLKICALLILLCLKGWGDTSRRFSYPTSQAELMSVPWQRDFVREPHQFDTKGMPPRKLFCFMVLGKIRTLDVRYLENHSRAQMKFYDWYLGDSPVSHEDQLRIQHETSALGQPGERQHYNHMTHTTSYQSKDAFPGVFRYELLRRNEIHLGIDEYVTTVEQWGLLFKNGFSDPAVQQGDNSVKFARSSYQLRTRGIPEELSTELLLLGGSKVRRVAPKGESEVAFRQAASDRMADLKKWRDKSPQEVKKDLDAFLNELSDYYHTSVQWMPFSAINNSLFMGHVNVLLRHFDLKPIPHDGLDYLALMSHHDTFRGIFKAAVLSANSQ